VDNRSFSEAGNIDINKVGAIALQLAAPLEYWRGNGGFSWNGEENYDRSYPGFYPLGITDFSTKPRARSAFFSPQV